MILKFFKVSILVLFLAVAWTTTVVAQSLITGELAGTVSDQMNAVIPNADVVLKSLDTGATQQTTTSSTGSFRFTLLKPGRYLVSIQQAKFAPVEQSYVVQVGQTTAANVVLSVAGQAQTMEVSGEAIPVIADNASVNTTFSALEMRNLPSAGGDITNIAQTAPGAVMNSTGGYGNFTVNGLPATSNLFTVNGENNMDPYFNINNSGATNLTLGANEVQETTIVANPYSGEYGQLSGAQITYVTRSGTNDFHGNAQYWWNGRMMNANNWMNNNSGTPRPFSNANQWAAAVGGPILKDRTFFFVDTEGLRFVLPNVIATTIPTPEFAAATLANIQRVYPAEAPMYQRMFNLFSGAKGANTAQALPNNSACSSLNLPGFNPATQSCFASFQATPTALASEWILAARLDQKLTERDNAFLRWKIDHGTQPSYLDPISSNFDAISNQPSWDLQLQETHVFGPKATNAFTAAGSHYVAQFQQDTQKAQSTFPQGLIFSGTVPIGPANGALFQMWNYPQGRNITQYQFIDDFTLIHNIDKGFLRGQHTFKFGGNFRRYDVSDHNFYWNTPATYFGYVNAGLQRFVNRLAYQYRQSDNIASNVPVAMWGLGIYGQDEWNVARSLKLTFALRVERNSNPVCQVNCFANLVAPYYGIPSVLAGPNGGNVPYNKDIADNQHQAYPGVDGLNWSPRVSFAWSPERFSGKTVFSGGFGLFYDSPPAGLVDNLLANPPVSVAIRVRPSAGTPAFDPGPNGSAATWQASANAFSTGYANGQTYNQIHAALLPYGVNFAAPAFNSIAGTMHAPRWQEWNFQLQQEINPVTALVINYVGNHGIRIPYFNSWFNAYDPNQLYNGLLPATAPNPNYGQVSQYANGGVSNYNGLTVSLRRQLSHWVSGRLNYTWAHNMDDFSNGGVFTYGDSLVGGQICPTSISSCNYGSSDYDIRNGLNGDFVFQPKWSFHNKFADLALNGWELSGKLFWRSGLPFSVIDGNWNGAITNTGAQILAQPTGNIAGQTSCGEGAASANGTANPCLNAAAFVDSASATFAGYTQFSTQRRNQYFGPRFFNMDMALYKMFALTERWKFGVGLQAFNVFNHPNFANPDNFLGDSTFGQINTMMGTPTSPYGNFLGFDSSPRVVQITGKIVF